MAARFAYCFRAIGGFPRVNGYAARLLEPLAKNPRALPLLEHVTLTLRGKVPDLRARVQSILARIRLPTCGGMAGAVQGTGAKRRFPLTAGVFPEVELRVPRIGWKGKVDLLVLSESGCEITDFKTGAPDHEAHKFQVQVYAVLWSLDNELNPTGRPVDRLLLSYEGGDIEVEPPKSTELSHLEKELIQRRAAAQASVCARPPEARLSSENCRFCGVRHLCDKYWMADSQRLATARTDPRFSDVELKIVRRHGPLSYDAVVVLSRVAHAGKPALFRVPQPVELRPGTRIRVLDAAVAVDLEDNEQPAIVTHGILSEMFAVE
jgi:PD-(D/E)XK nuclease superfamily